MIHSASRTLALVLWIGSVPAHGAEAAQPAKPTGTICIAPFHVQTPKPDGLPSIGEPNLSLTTWGPAHDSKFTFRIDGRLRATVANHEMAVIEDLPTNRRIRLTVGLDGKPYETFSLDLRKEPEHRVCLWLYPDYWHWIDNGWTAKLGCKCGDGSAPGSP